MRKYKRYAYIAVGVFLLVAFFLARDLIGLQGRERELRQDLQAQERNVEMMRQDYNILALEKELAMLRDKLVSENFIPDYHPRPDLSILINEMAINWRVNILSLRPREEETYKLREGEYLAHRDSVKVEGQAGNLFAFIDSLEGANIPILVANIDLAPSAGYYWIASFDIIALTRS